MNTVNEYLITCLMKIYLKHTKKTKKKRKDNLLAEKN